MRQTLSRLRYGLEANASKQLFHPTPGNLDAENTNLLGNSDGPNRKAASP